MVSPNNSLVLLVSIFSGFFVPFSYLFLRFYFDNKIHVRDDLQEQITKMSFLGELPHIKNDKIKKISTKLSKDEMSEAIRILVSNLKFTLLNNPEDKSVKGKVILVTSSIKGEGKTVVSVNTSSILSTSGKKQF